MTLTRRDLVAGTGALALSAMMPAAPASGPLDVVNTLVPWDSVQDLRAWMPLGVAGVIVWSLWIYRWVLSRAYRPVSNTFVTTTSVVVPSFREDVEILRLPPR